MLNPKQRLREVAILPLREKHAVGEDKAPEQRVRAREAMLGAALYYARCVSGERSLASLTAEDFRLLVGTRFGVAAGGFESELIEVTELGGPAGAGLRSPFSLVLRGPLEPLLRQGTHSLEHGQLGELDLFLVPIGPDETGMRYEAVFG